MTRYPRDMRGYGTHPPQVEWQGKAKIAVQFVLNYEEGGENCLLHGDAGSEAFLSEIVGVAPWAGMRHWNMESIYEYGARAGFWRLHRLFTEAKIPLTIYGVATALARSPEQVSAMLEAEWEIASHGYKWIDYKDFTAKDEAKHVADAIRLHTETTGTRPLGWYTGRCSLNTVNLVCKAGGFTYISDSYADDLPYWHIYDNQPHLIIPYTLDANDMRFAAVQGFNAGDQFFNYLKDSFDALYREGAEGAPKMLSIGLHCRLIGRPGRIESLRRFIDYIASHDGVWCPRRIDIAEHWHQHHPFDMKAWQVRPSGLNKTDFVKRFGAVFEHAPWVAEGVFALELGGAHDSAIGLHNAFCRVFRRAGYDRQLEILRAHPDLAGTSKRLTTHGTDEQISVALDAFTDDEWAQFADLDQRYKHKFGHPFILAVKGKSKAEIIKIFTTRLEAEAKAEFAEACRQVEKIALLRLKDLV